MGVPSRFESASQSPGYQLWLVCNAWQRRIRAALKRFDLTHVQFVLLAVTAKISEQGIATNQAQISKAAGIDKMMTSQVLRSLEAKGLVKRSADQSDARALLIVLTDLGEALIAKAFERVEQTDIDFFGVLGADIGKFAEYLYVLTASDADAD